MDEYLIRSLAVIPGVVVFYIMVMRFIKIETTLTYKTLKTRERYRVYKKIFRGKKDKKNLFVEKISVGKKAQKVDAL